MNVYDISLTVEGFSDFGLGWTISVYFTGFAWDSLLESLETLSSWSFLREAWNL